MILEHVVAKNEEIIMSHRQVIIVVCQDDTGLHESAPNGLATNKATSVYY